MMRLRIADTARMEHPAVQLGHLLIAETLMAAGRWIDPGIHAVDRVYIGVDVRLFQPCLLYTSDAADEL